MRPRDLNRGSHERIRDGSGKQRQRGRNFTLVKRKDPVGFECVRFSRG